MSIDVADNQAWCLRQNMLLQTISFAGQALNAVAVYSTLKIAFRDRNKHLVKSAIRIGLWQIEHLERKQIKEEPPLKSSCISFSFLRRSDLPNVNFPMRLFIQ